MSINESPARMRPQRDVELPCREVAASCPHYRSGWCYCRPEISYSVRTLAWCPMRGPEHGAGGKHEKCSEKARG